MISQAKQTLYDIDEYSDTHKATAISLGGLSLLSTLMLITFFCCPRLCARRRADGGMRSAPMQREGCQARRRARRGAQPLKRSAAEVEDEADIYDGESAEQARFAGRRVGKFASRVWRLCWRLLRLPRRRCNGEVVEEEEEEEGGAEEEEGIGRHVAF